MRTIIVGIDLSSTAERALGHAVEIGRTQGADVVMVMADLVPEAPEGLAPSARVAAESYARSLLERLTADRSALGALFQKWQGRGVSISQLVVDGYPDDQLPRVAAERGADLVVVGSHGRTGWRRLLLGSVAERVVRLAPCSVLVARGDASDLGYRRVVVGTDFSPCAERALARALEIAAPDAHIDLVHCFQMSPILSPPDAPAMIPTYDKIRVDVLAELAEQGKTLVERLRAQAAPGRTFAFHLLERPAAHGVDDFARDHGADLVVVGSHGRRGVRRFLLGSIAEVAVRHAPCSVLVAR